MAGKYIAKPYHNNPATIKRTGGVKIVVDFKFMPQYREKKPQ
jgi:hypothetical protein